MHCSMPEGVSYKKPKGIILSQQIVAMQQILEQQLASIEQRELETQRFIFSNGTISSEPFEDSPFLISLIKSAEAPYKEQFAFITVIKDFNLILSPGKKYNLALTEVAIAIQFECSTFNYMQILIGQVVIEYLQSRLRYLSEVETVDGEHLDQIFQYYEINPKFTREYFEECNVAAIQSCKNFI